MNAYDLYGIKNSSLTSTRTKLEKVMGVVFEERESIYQGGIYFFYGDRASENFILKTNVDPFDGEPVEQDFVNSPILFYVNATNRSSELMILLIGEEGIDLLRHKML